MRAEEGASPLLRRGFLGLGTVTTLALAIELAAERHWTQPVQWIAWAALGLALAALGLLLGRASSGRVLAARVLAAVVVVSALLGVWEHVASNYDAGELDQVYGPRWETLPASSRWWLAMSKSVGPSPPLAAGALAQVGACVLLATLRHPARRSR
ncbi:MAG: hypothetical protein IT306_20275 [Chloroflexi bacterium]|nr:hypothetical protein [Chloroflexota bacterium]